MEELLCRSKENELKNMIKCFPVSLQTGEGESADVETFPVTSTKHPKSVVGFPAGTAGLKYLSGSRPKFGLSAIILSFGMKKANVYTQGARVAPVPKVAHKEKSRLRKLESPAEKSVNK